MSVKCGNNIKHFDYRFGEENEKIFSIRLEKVF